MSRLHPLEEESEAGLGHHDVGRLVLGGTVALALFDRDASFDNLAGNPGVLTAWRFVVWSGYHGDLLAAERATGRRILRVLTFLVVSLA